MEWLQSPTPTMPIYRNNYFVKKQNTAEEKEQYAANQEYSKKWRNKLDQINTQQYNHEQYIQKVSPNWLLTMQYPLQKQELYTRDMLETQHSLATKIDTMLLKSRKTQQ